MIRSISLQALGFSLLLSCMAPAVSAADQIGLFFDAAATSRVSSIPAFTPRSLYAVIVDPSLTPELSEMSIALPAGWTILGRSYGAGCVIIDPLDPYDFQAPTCLTCSDPTPARLAALTLNLAWFSGPMAPENVEVCLGPYSGTSFDPPTPGYRSCSGEDVPLQYVEDFPLCPVAGPVLSGNCALINPYVLCPIGVDDTSWSALKAIY